VRLERWCVERREDVLVVGSGWVVVGVGWVIVGSGRLWEGGSRKEVGRAENSSYVPLFARAPSSSPAG
jgi:hypothetical protein